MPLKIKIVQLEPNKRKKVRHGYCAACGCKLTDPDSIRAGYGRKCFGKHTAIILEMIPDKQEK